MVQKQISKEKTTRVIYNKESSPKKKFELEPSKKLRGLQSFKSYAKELKYRSPTVRKAIAQARKEEIRKAVQQEVKRLKYQRQFEKRPITATTQQVALQEQKAQARQRKIGLMGSRAEQLEIEAVTFNEIPMLRNMEIQRTRLTSPPNKRMTDIIKEVSDSFPQ